MIHEKFEQFIFLNYPKIHSNFYRVFYLYNIYGIRALFKFYIFKQIDSIKNKFISIFKKTFPKIYFSCIVIKRHMKTVIIEIQNYNRVEVIADTINVKPVEFYGERSIKEKVDEIRNIATEKYNFELTEEEQ